MCRQSSDLWLQKDSSRNHANSKANCSTICSRSDVSSLEYVRLNFHNLILKDCVTRDYVTCDHFGMYRNHMLDEDFRCDCNICDFQQTTIRNRAKAFLIKQDAQNQHRND